MLTTIMENFGYVFTALVAVFAWTVVRAARQIRIEVRSASYRGQR